jgi:hypothetical protein
MSALTDEASAGRRTTSNRWRDGFAALGGGAGAARSTLSAVPTLAAGCRQR